MLSSTMRSAVLQATVLFTMSMILSHHMEQSMFTEVWQDDGFLTMIKMFNDTGNTRPSQKDSQPRIQASLEAGNTTDSKWTFNTTAVYPNGTTVHQKGSVRVNKATTTNSTSSAGLKEPYLYSRVLPREIVIYIVIAALQYWWFIALERMLPARPRGKIQIESYEKAEENEDREEEVVKKWIAQGRVRRASLNWCNTFLKWVLELTVGRLWYHTVEHVIRVLVKLESPTTILSELQGHLVYNFISAFFSAAPLATLMALILVPAHKRIVFMAGFELAMTIFIQTVVRVFATWAVKTDFIQTVMKNMTEYANLTSERPDWKKEPRVPRIGDEL